MKKYENYINFITQQMISKAHKRKARRNLGNGGGGFRFGWRIEGVGGKRRDFAAGEAAGGSFSSMGSCKYTTGDSTARAEEARGYSGAEPINSASCYCCTVMAKVVELLVLLLLTLSPIIQWRKL